MTVCFREVEGPSNERPARGGGPFRRWTTRTATRAAKARPAPASRNHLPLRLPELDMALPPVGGNSPPWNGLQDSPSGPGTLLSLPLPPSLCQPPRRSPATERYFPDASETGLWNYSLFYWSALGAPVGSEPALSGTREGGPERVWQDGRQAGCSRRKAHHFRACGGAGCLPTPLLQWQAGRTP